MNKTRSTSKLLALLVIAALGACALMLVLLWTQPAMQPETGSVGRAVAAAPPVTDPPAPLRHMLRPASPPVVEKHPAFPVLYAGDNAQDAPVRGVEAAILGGKEATPGAYPWQAALVLAEESNALFGQVCGGTLIAPQWVLTAAHCVDWGVTPEELDVILGRHRLSTSEGERIRVDDFIVHPQYNDFSLDYDYALVHLSQASSQPTVSLDGANDSVLEGQRAMATVIGWGVYSDNYYLASDPLLEVQIPLQPRDVCNSFDAWYPWITERMICAGDEDAGESPCYGDSGGPLFVRNEDDSDWTQIGIVSWGPNGCNTPGLYAVFARVSSARTWIDSCFTAPNSVLCRGEGTVPDLSEPNNGPESAELVEPNSPARRLSFHMAADSDWMRFDAKPGVVYWIESETLGIRSDTVLWLRKDDGYSPLRVNDDKGGADYNLGSRIVWTAPYSGTVYVQSHSISAFRYGRETQYEMAIYGLDQKIFIPLVLAQ